MTSIAKTAEYAREYQRRKAAGLPTVGLAAEIRAGAVIPILPPATLRQGQDLYGQGAVTSQVMRRLGLSYSEAQAIRSSLA